jgi:NAD(P)-dependent dehydrogenase (short-subunit alcohol dehydrogenase family)
MTDTTDMQGKTVLITGGTSGVGQVSARELARRGARIVLIARDRSRTDSELEALEAIAPGRGHAAYFADLFSMHDVRGVAAEIAAAEPRIDVLINNAGANLGAGRKETVDGLEKTFALNHMAPFVLTDGLVDTVCAMAPARIINTASDRAMVTKLNFADLQAVKRYGGMDAYCKSKLCNIYFTHSLSRRLRNSGVTVNAWNPGFTRTRFMDAQPLWMRIAARLSAGDPEDRARTLTHLAADAERAGDTDTFWAHMTPGKMSAASRDSAAAEQLWRASVEIFSTLFGASPRMATLPTDG